MKRTATVGSLIAVVACGSGAHHPDAGGRLDAAAHDAGIDGAFDAAPDSSVDSGPAPRCEVRDPSSFGDCGQEIGAVFDGRYCVLVQGCPDQATRMYAHRAQCAMECAAAGHCGDNIANVRYPVGSGHEHCDLFNMCLSDVYDVEDIARVAPDAYCPGGETCESCFIDSVTVDEELAPTLCALSLLPQIFDIGCILVE